MTAFSNKKTVNECKQAGMIGVLYKPVNKRGFEDQIKKSADIEMIKFMSAKLKEMRK